MFDGEQVIESDQLKNKQVVSQYKASTGKLHEQERDISKSWFYEDQEILIIGIENQNDIDKQIVLRTIGYDAAQYKEQYTKTSELVVPIITIVLYYGNLHWEQSQSLSEVSKPIPEKAQRFYSDYQTNIIEIAWLSDEQLDMFTSDFGIIARFFVEIRRNKNYIPKDKTKLDHPDEVLKLLAVMTKDNRYEKILAGERQVKNMCEVAERLVNMGIERGRVEGIERGIERGREEERIHLLVKLVNNGNLGIEIAAMELGVTSDEFKRKVEEFDN